MTKKHNNLGTKLSIAFGERDLELANELAGRLPMKRAALIREAARLGLRLLEEDPARLVKRPRPTAREGA